MSPRAADTNHADALGARAKSSTHTLTSPLPHARSAPRGAAQDLVEDGRRQLAPVIGPRSRRCQQEEGREGRRQAFAHHGRGRRSACLGASARRTDGSATAAQRRQNRRAVHRRRRQEEGLCAGEQNCRRARPARETRPAAWHCLYVAGAATTRRTLQGTSFPRGTGVFQAGCFNGRSSPSLAGVRAPQTEDRKESWRRTRRHHGRGAARKVCGAPPHAPPPSPVPRASCLRATALRAATGQTGSGASMHFAPARRQNRPRTTLPAATDPGSTVEWEFHLLSLDPQEEWEQLGLDKRIDYDNLKRVFERLDFKDDGRIDQEELAATYRVLFAPRVCSLALQRRPGGGARCRARARAAPTPTAPGPLLAHFCRNWSTSRGKPPSTACRKSRTLSGRWTRTRTDGSTGRTLCSCTSGVERIAR